MKITSGTFKGLNLACPDGMEVRPTSAKTRQAIFNMLRPYLADSVCIDCFAGTGALGLEALSNGASKAYFVDDSHADVIKRNAQKTKAQITNYEIIEADFRAALKKLHDKKIKADIIFADPPYNKDLISVFVKLVKVNELLKDDGLLIIEAHRKEAETMKDIFEEWRMLRDKEYGDVFIFALQKIGGVK